ncbi:hypothetical protein SAMD00019534_109900, partial [Acytostelium subglobosum LB1]|uniref:hypothetical protein n=1 Tax=Acytostelium subglobosum LB1 TaxID=1410327 RepID=UPI000644ED99
SPPTQSIINMLVTFPQSSGVKLASNCIEVFDQMKMRKQHGLVFYKMNEKSTEIVVEKTFPTDVPFSTFLEELPTDQCRYVLVDFAYTDNSLLKKKNLVFVSWCPSKASTRNKMIHAASRDAIRKALVGIKAEVQGCGLSEVQEDNITEKLLRL